MALIRFEWATAATFLCGICFYPALWLGTVQRVFWLFLMESLIAGSPLLIPRKATDLRLISAIIAVTVGIKLYDLHRLGGRGFRPSWWLFLGYLPNPFALALDKVRREPRPPWRRDLLQLSLGALGSAAAIELLIRVFRIDWQPHPFVLQHGAKVISFFLLLLFFANGAAAGLRLCGLPATNFSGNFFLARTPAEFWRQYNRPAAQLFYEDVFKPIGGLHRPVMATLLTFAASGIIHEYVFDIPARRILGWQMVFFMVQGLAALATIRIKPRGWRAAVCVMLTFAFNLSTGVLFFKCMNQAAPFYSGRMPAFVARATSP